MTDRRAHLMLSSDEDHGIATPEAAAVGGTDVPAAVMLFEAGDVAAQAAVDTLAARQYDADVMAFGSGSFSLPPAQSTTVEATVIAQSAFLPEGWVRVIRGWPHMHLLGVAQSTEVFRDGQKIGDLGSTSTYSAASLTRLSETSSIRGAPGRWASAWARARRPLARKEVEVRHAAAGHRLAQRGSIQHT